MTTPHFLTSVLLGSVLLVGTLDAGTPSSFDAGWPNISGPTGNFQAIAPESDLLDNLTLATLAWESETKELGAGKGGGVKRSSRQDLVNSFGKDRIRWAGSLTGPIVANGVVYVSSFRPAGKWVELKGRALRNGVDEFEEPIRLQVEAEDTLTAIDMETGKTRWTFATPGGLCWTHGKRGGLQIAPAYANGTVYFVGTQGMLYAVSAETGKERWRAEIGGVVAYKKRAKEMYLKGPNPEWDKKTARAMSRLPTISDGLYREPNTPTWHGGVRVLGNVVVSNDSGSGLVAFDAVTGERLWSKGGITSYIAAPSVWEHEGNEYLLVASAPQKTGAGGNLRLLNPVDGEELWAEPIGPTSPTLAPHGNKVLVNIRIPEGKEDLNKGLLACYEIGLEGAKKLWTLPDEPHYYIPLKKDSLGKVRYTLQGDRAFIRTHGLKKVASPHFLIVDAEQGKILQELKGGGKLALPNALMWYVQGDLIYATWDRHHSPNRGGRKPLSLSRWSDDGIELLGDEHGPWALDLANITGGYEVTMEHPIVDGRMFERTTDGTLVCYDLRKQEGETMITLKAEGAWQGLPEALPLSLRVQRDRLVQGAAWPSSGREVAQVYTTSRVADFWRDFPVEGLRLKENLLSGTATLDIVGEALPTTYIGLELDVTRSEDSFTGTWRRAIPAEEGHSEQKGPITGSMDAEYRSTPTPWISPGARHRFYELGEGEQCITMTLMGAMPPKRDGQRQLLSLNLLHDGTRFTAASGGAFRFSQGWHEVDATELTFADGKITGSVIVLAHGDNFGTHARKEGDGPLAGRITVDAALKDGRFEGSYVVNWGIPYEAMGSISGTAAPLP